MRFAQGVGCRFALAALVVAPVRRAAARSAVATPPDAAGGRDGHAAVALPAGYVIGPDDVLSIVFWRDKDMSADVVVRPDGKISLPLLNDVQAAGLTPDQLRARVDEGGGEIRRRSRMPPSSSRRSTAARSSSPGTWRRPGPYPLIGRHDRAAVDRAWPAGFRSTPTPRTS